MLEHCKLTPHELARAPIDTLYIDDSFCNPACVFPPRSVAAQQIIDLINKHPDHSIIIGMDTLGKEELLVAIALACESLVCLFVALVMKSLSIDSCV